MKTQLLLLLLVQNIDYGFQLDIREILQIFTGQTIPSKKVLEDWRDCGELGEVVIDNRDSIRNNLDSGCLKNCDWLPNPYHKATIRWPLYIKTNKTADKKRNSKRQNNECYILSEYVSVLITAPKVPSNLRCLKNCLREPANNSSKIRKNRNIERCDENDTLPFVPEINDLIAKYKDSIQYSTFISNDPPTVELFGEEDDESAKFREDISFLRATNPFELSLEICVFASSVKGFEDGLAEDYADYADYGFNGEILAAFNTLFELFPETCKFPNARSRVKDKIFGSTTERAKQNTFPWLCSLKEAGFKGNHRCGVTLLSGPPDPILVSAAHCNYVCKDNRTMQLQEICCCRESSELASCRKESSYCTENAQLTKALPHEMQIVCGEHSLVVQPEEYSDEIEVVLEILEIIIHEDYSPGEPDGERKGPYLGSDIAVYKVNSTRFFYENGTSRLKRKVLYPACLPRENEQYGSERGIFAAWNDPEPAYRVNGNATLQQYEQIYFYPRQVVMEEVECKDPEWMKSETYYPPGTDCYIDPSLASCVLFGNSGAGVVRKVDKINGTRRYAYTGPLSLNKGCDSAWKYKNSITYASKNPSVFTNAYCYMDWIAEQYGMSMPNSYKKPENCNKSKGLIDDIDKSFCRANGHVWGENTEQSINDNFQIYFADGVEQGETYCNFNQVDEEGKPFDKCRLLAQEGYAYNLYQCKDQKGRDVICANNCKGVDPNNVVVGGSAVLAAAAVGGISSLAMVFGIGTVALAGAGTVANGLCPIWSCNVRGRCCRILLVRGRLRCPSNC